MNPLKTSHMPLHMMMLDQEGNISIEDMFNLLQEMYKDTRHPFYKTAAHCLAYGLNVYNV